MNGTCAAPTPVMQAFTAQGYFADGTNGDVTSQVTWTSSNAPLGSFGTAATAALFTSNTMSGFTTIGATLTPPDAGVPIVGKTILTLVAQRIDTTDPTNPTPIDFFFVAPYKKAPTPANEPLVFGTNIQEADIAFVIDTTGSMGPKITNVESSLSSLASSLSSQISSVAMGVADFDSWPCAPDGSNKVIHFPGGSCQPDYTYKLDNRMITVGNGGLAQIQKVITGLTLSCGGDGPEPDFDALYFAASGAAQTDASCGGWTLPAFNPATAPGGLSTEQTGTLGGMGFRPNALPIFVIVSDAESQDQGDPASGISGVSYAHSHAAALAAIQGIGGKVVGVASTCGDGGPPFTCDTYSPIFDGAAVSNCCVAGGGWEPTPQFLWLAEQTGSEVPPSAFAGGVCATGVGGATMPPDPATGKCPLVYQVDQTGNGLGTSLTDAIVKLVNYGVLNVGVNIVGKTTDESGNALTGGHTTADFISPIVATDPKGVVALSSMPAVGATGGPTSIMNNQFMSTQPGTKVTFTVTPYNDFVPQQAVPQFFKANIQVMGNMTSPGTGTLLDQRDVNIIVPAANVIM
jgi:hypothetical protein